MRVGTPTTRYRFKPCVEAMRSAIEKNQEVQGGTPVIRGTRLPVEHLIEHINADYSFEQYARIFHIDVKLARRAYREAVSETRTRGRQPA